MPKQKLYVANTTTQEVKLYYSVPIEGAKHEDGRQKWSFPPSIQTIPAGTQELLASGREFSDFEATALLDMQSRNYGAVTPGDKRLGKGFKGLIWSTKPIDLDSILDGMQQNQDAAHDRAERMLDNTAAAQFDREQKRAHEHGGPSPQRVELEIQETAPKGAAAPTSEVPSRGAEVVASGVRPRNVASRNRR